MRSGKIDEAIHAVNGLLQVKELIPTLRYLLLFQKANILGFFYLKPDESFAITAQAEKIYSQLTTDDKKSIITTRTKFDLLKGRNYYFKGSVLFRKSWTIWTNFIPEIFKKVYF